MKNMDVLDLNAIFELIEGITSEHDFQQFKSTILGKNGSITNALKALRNLSVEEKAKQGKKLNTQKQDIEALFEIKLKNLQNTKKTEQKIDYTIPQNIKLGMEHIISNETAKLHEIFAQSGFEHIIGPDIESVFYNFEALNIPIEHPARDNQDTFYMKNEDHENETVLRTHTTSAQIRLLESMNGELQQTRSYSIGRVYRNDTHDATHACSFHQIEGVILEEGITIEHLKGFWEYLLSVFFEQNVKIRFRPSYFPFTEPSCEMDIFTKIIDNKRIICDDGQPMEIGGCGVIHPTILSRFSKNKKNNDEVPVALAWGIGLERLIMIKHGITNLHDMYNNQIPTLKHIFHSSKRELK